MRNIEFKSDDIVLLVGANNVGKSRTLKDLTDDLNDLSKPKVIIDEVVYRSSDFSSDQLNIKAILKNISSFKLLKSGGKNILPQGECVSLFNQMKNFLNEHKVFILECGEIERFVPDVGGHGNVWVEKTFTRYENFNDPVYDEAKRFVKSVFNI